MKLYINHTFNYQTQHISMLFFNHVDVFFYQGDTSPIDTTAILSEFTENDNSVVITAKILHNGAAQCISQQQLKLNQDKKDYKYAVSVTLFNTLKKYTGKCPSWGILTGVRPTKRYHSLIFKGFTKKDISNYFMQHDLVLPEKVNLLAAISEQSYPHISSRRSDQISLYIGIPFCPSKCVYCSFTTAIKEKGDGLIEAYVQALIKDIVTTAEQYVDKTVQTLYIGGGTPAMLSTEQIKRIHSAIVKFYNLDNLVEYTFEAGRPELIDDDLLMTLKYIGVTRICINPQTMHDDSLKIIGRTHTVASIIKAFNLASAYNFIINTDMIAGLLNESVDKSISSIQQMLALKPHNITLHTLSLKKGSILFNRQDDYLLTPEREVAKVVRCAHEMLTDAGYLPYYMYRQKYISGNLENVGYTKRGFENIYNIQMIEEKQTIIAFGAGTTTKIYDAQSDTLSRTHTTKSIQAYITEQCNDYFVQ